MMEEDFDFMKVGRYYKYTDNSYGKPYVGRYLGRKPPYYNFKRYSSNPFKHVRPAPDHYQSRTLPVHS